MRYGSLFSGIGGIDLGFDRAGMECLWQVEIDNYATKVLEKHWPKVHREKDIRECGKHNLKWVDVIAGGFPCQDISYAGRGAGLDGERSGLFFEAVRVVRELQPRYVVLENVAALLTRGLDRVLGTLAEIGFNAEWHCIPAAVFGAPHIRNRVFVLGRNTNSKHDYQVRSWSKKNTNASRDRDGENKSQSIPHANCQRLERQRIIASGIKSELDNISDPRWWETEPAVGRVADGVPNRVDRLRGLGNAVVPQVAEWIGRQLMQIEREAIK